MVWVSSPVLPLRQTGMNRDLQKSYGISAKHILYNLMKYVVANNCNNILANTGQ